MFQALGNEPLNPHTDQLSSTSVWAVAATCDKSNFLCACTHRFQPLLGPCAFSLACPYRAHLDPNWTPLLGTPQHPEYPSAHAGVFNAGIAVILRTLNITVDTPVPAFTLSAEGCELQKPG